MFGEKKHWQLSNPFRILSGKRDPRPKSEVGHSRNCVSSVYLSDGTSASGFIVVPEFDGSAQTHTTHESGHSTYPLMLPVVTSSDSLLPNGIDDYLCDLESMGFNYSSCHEGGFGNISVPNQRWDDNFSQRLGSAYEHIRCMPCVIPPRSPLSSDPQMLRKQLGVPQHSVLNYPIHSSPDLPNPHTFPYEPMSPDTPSTRSPEVAHATTLKKLGLCMDTDVYPVSHLHGLPRKKSTAAAPTVTEDSFSQCSVLEAPRNAHSSLMLEPHSLVTCSSTSDKSHAEEPITLSSSLPSSSRPVSKGVLRKRNPDTPPCMSLHKRQISLPHIRPPSPIKVDIPLHHTWHERRTDFDSFLGRNVKKGALHGTKSRRLSGSTDFLASLAWTGTSSMSSSDITNKRHHFADPACLPDRLSMAIAMEDDSISDDALVARLENVRRISGFFDRERDTSHQGSFGWNGHFPESGGDPSGNLHDAYPSSTSSAPSAFTKFCDVLFPSPPIMPDAISHSEDAEVWQAARKALLCVREIVRTEKKYQEALRVLLNAQTATPPPPSMDPYISALVRASETLLRCFLDDLSAWGVSTAFVTSEDELEVAMVSWCTVAGAFFIDENDPRSIGLIGRWRHRRSGVTSSPSPTKSTSTPSSPRVPSLPIVGTTGKTKEQKEEEIDAWQCPRIGNEKRPTFTSLVQKSGHTEDTNSRPLTGRPPSRKPSVRELAIQPIQRVMRYVLLYRDLKDCTPPASPSRILAERALEAAMRIAKHCDKAQRNPAFFRAS